mgnify:CR=1 FL=1
MLSFVPIKNFCKIFFPYIFAALKHNFKHFVFPLSTVCLCYELLCNHQSTYKPMFFIDKDPQKIGNNAVGLKVYPEDEQTLKLIKEQRITELFVAVANLDNEEATRLFEFYSKTKCKLKIYDIPVKDFNRDDDSGEKGKVIRDFQIEDLLFRKPMKINNSATRAYYSGKTILVTGGGGSIGSELCRQIAKCSPKKLIILDIYENNAYEIQQELKRLYGDNLDLVVEIDDLALVRRLFVSRRVVFRVLGQVAVTSRLGDAFYDLLTFHGL